MDTERKQLIDPKAAGAPADPCAGLSADDEMVRINHALRTALTAILGFSEVIGQELLGPVGNPQYRQYAQDIHETGRQLMNFMEDVHQTSLAGGNPPSQPYAVCHVPAAVAEAQRLAGQLAKDAGVDLAIDIPETIPALKADQRAVQQIILTLLLNAIRASDQGDVVSAVADVSRSGEFRLTVQSQVGSLLPPPPQPMARPADHCVNLQTIVGQAAKLGLDIPKQLVELHGGQLEVHCIPEFGLRLTARFPRAWILDIS